MCVCACKHTFLFEFRRVARIPLRYLQVRFWQLLVKSTPSLPNKRPILHYTRITSSIRRARPTHHTQIRLYEKLVLHRRLRPKDLALECGTKMWYMFRTALQIWLRRRWCNKALWRHIPTSCKVYIILDIIPLTPWDRVPLSIGLYNMMQHTRVSFIHYRRFHLNFSVTPPSIIPHRDRGRVFWYGWSSNISSWWVT